MNNINNTNNSNPQTNSNSLQDQRIQSRQNYLPIREYQKLRELKDEIEDEQRLFSEDELTEKEKQIIEYRYGLNGNKSMSLKQIGEKYDLTKERIRQIEKKALVRLRHSSRSDKLRAFIES